MASLIDETKPVSGSPTTQSVRDQFATAKSEITALQAAVAGAGAGTITGVTAGSGLTGGGTSGAVTVSLAQPVPVSAGGTGSTTAAAALTALGAAPLASPVLTGNPTAPTPATADNDTSIATTAYVKAQGYATSAAMTAADNLRVLKAGDTMSGVLTIDLAAGSDPFKVRTIPGNNARVLYDNGWVWGAGVRSGNTYALTDLTAGFDRITITNGGGGVITLGAPTTVGGTLTGAAGCNLSGALDVAATIRSTGATTPAAGSGVEVTYTGGNGYLTVYNHTGAAYLPLTVTAFGIALDGQGALVTVSTSSGLAPQVDNNCYCGSPALAWYQVNAHNYATISDPVKKTDIAQVEGALAHVMAIAPMSFRWKADPAGAPLHWGFMVPDVAREMGPEFAGAVLRPEGHSTLDYNSLTAVLWRAVQELAAKVDALSGPAPQRRRP